MLYRLSYRLPRRVRQIIGDGAGSLNPEAAFAPMIPAMPLVRDRCICVRKTEYSETSQILVLFGRGAGLFRVIAKGAHRRTKAGSSKFDGGIDLLDVGEAVAILDPAKDLGTLTEWSQREGQLALHQNLRAVYLGLYAAELVSTLLEEHDPHPALYQRFETTLGELASPRVEELFLAFELDLLHETGLAPEISACGGCGQAVDTRAEGFFSPERGGVVCRRCEGATPDRLVIDPRLLRLMQQILALPRAAGLPQRLPRLSRHQTDPLNAMLARHVQHAAARPLRMPPYVL